MSNVTSVANLHEDENEDGFPSGKRWIPCIANIISLKVKLLFTLTHFDGRELRIHEEFRRRNLETQRASLAMRTGDTTNGKSVLHVELHRREK